MVLGSFNLDRVADPLYEAFISIGLWPPTKHDTVPRTIFDDDNTRHFYDQIAWFLTRTTQRCRGAALRDAGKLLRLHPAHLPRTQPRGGIHENFGPLPALVRIPTGLTCRGFLLALVWPENN